MNSLVDKHPAYQGVHRILSRVLRNERLEKIKHAYSALRLKAPSLSDAALILRANPTDIRGFVINRQIDALLAVRGRLPRGLLRPDRRPLAHELETALLRHDNDVHPGGAEYAQLARSISRQISLHHPEAMSVNNLEDAPQLCAILPYLAEHLKTEVELALELNVPSGKLGVSLAKFGLFDVADMYYRVRDIALKGDSVVADNFATIVYAALSRTDLNLAYRLAEGAKQKRDRIREKYKNDFVVMHNLDTMINAALVRADLDIWISLPQKQKRREIQ